MKLVSSRHQTSHAISAVGSKYDLITIKVRFDDTSLYYVFSRYLISRYLLGVQVRVEDASRIALLTKKALVAQGVFEVVQSHVEATLFSIMRDRFGYGPELCERFQEVTKFHLQRIPLVILVNGPPRCGSSSLCRALVESLCSVHVLPVDVVLKTYQALKLLPFPTDAWKYPTCPMLQEEQTRDEPSSGVPSEDAQWCEQHDVVKRVEALAACTLMGVRYELDKCLREGKLLLIEGSAMNPCALVEAIAQLRAQASSSSAAALALNDSRRITVCVFSLSPWDDAQHRELVALSFLRAPSTHQEVRESNEACETARLDPSCESHVDGCMRRMQYLKQWHAANQNTLQIMAEAYDTTHRNGDALPSSLVRVRHRSIHVDVLRLQKCVDEMHYFILEEMRTALQQNKQAER